MANILILGAYGLLGSSLSDFLFQEGYTVYRQGRRENAQCISNPLSSQWVKSFLTEKNIDVVVNLIAATNVDQCEIDPNFAYSGNVQPVEIVVEGIISSQMSPHLIQISTDHVYGGIGPHAEDNVLLLNNYAKSKYQGELVAQSVNSTILRTNFLGRSRNPSRVSLTDWMIGSLAAGKSIKAFSDVLITPLHINTLCEVISLSIARRHIGIFNVGCFDGHSKAFLATELAKNLDFDLNLIELGSASNLNLIARRPSDMRMISDKFSKKFNYLVPTFQSQVHLTVKECNHA